MGVGGNFLGSSEYFVSPPWLPNDVVNRIDLPFGDCLYNPFMVIFWMVYYWVYYIHSIDYLSTFAEEKPMDRFHTGNVQTLRSTNEALDWRGFSFLDHWKGEGFV